MKKPLEQGPSKNERNKTMKHCILRRVTAAVLVIACAFQAFPIIAFASSTQKQYRYHRYIDNKGNVSVCPYYGNWKYDTSSMKIEYSEWLSQPLKVDNGKYSCYTHVYQGSSCDKAGCIDPSCDTDRYVDENGTYWYYQETRTVEVQPPVMPEATAAPQPTVAPQVTTAPEVTAAPETTAAPQPTTVPEPVPTPKPTATPKPTPTPEKTPAPELKDTPYEADTVVNQIGAGLTGYALDLIKAVVDTFTPTDTLSLGKELLSFKDTAKALLDAAVLGKIEDETIATALWNIYEYSLDGEIPDDMLSYAAELYLEALDQQPELWEPVIKITIQKSPKLALWVAAKGAGGKVKALELVVNVFEASADKYWELGEAVASYQEVGSEHSQDIIRYYNGFMDDHYEAMELVAEAAYRDRSSGKTEFLENVKNLQVAHENSKTMFKDVINEALTFWFRLFHPFRTNALENILDELDNLDVNYEDCYWQIMNGN